MTKIKRIEDYLSNFLNNNIYEFDLFWETTNQQRTEGVYRLENGSEILDFLNDVRENIADKLRFPRLVPDRFTTPEDLLDFLKSFKEFIESKSYLLKENDVNEDTHYIIQHLIIYKNKIIKAIKYAFQIYDLEDENILLYQQLRYHLIKEDTDAFINDLKTIFSLVSYAIVKETEGYYHANVYLILRLLGFEIIPEDTTNIGRIDAVIRFSDKIYIVEFKFSVNTDDSQKALNQIIDNDYARKYRLENKVIFGLGISFNEKIRSIRNYQVQQL